MDKYLKRLSTEEVEEMRRAKRPRLKQATLQSLKGVINVKRVLELKKILECKHASEKHIVDCLVEIEADRCLPVHILTETGIGRAIGPLRKHSNLTIANKSKLLVDQWKQKIQDMPVAPVVNNSKKKLSLLMQSGGPDDDVRRKAVGLFKSNMSSSGDSKVDDEQAKLWEKSIYVKNDMKIDKTYKLKVRQKVFELKRSKPSSSKDVVET